jgi:hypothetical protein
MDDQKSGHHESGPQKKFDEDVALEFVRSRATPQAKSYGVSGFTWEVEEWLLEQDYSVFEPKIDRAI